MARWKALPEDLDPEVREFAEQLRRLVDRSGLSIAAVSDHTGYSKTSWERYLNGRILAPKGAVVALAEVTGTSPIHLTTMWELAERAWSRAEARHDRTMEQIRISQARAALGEDAPSASGPGSGGPQSRTADPGPDRAAAWPPYKDQLEQAVGPAGPGHAAGPGRRRPAPSHSGRHSGQNGGGRAASGGNSRKALMFLGGVVGALAVVAAAVLLTDLGGGGDKPKPVAEPKPSASASASALPDGVKCSGEKCAGGDPQVMGCGGEFAKTVSTAAAGTAKIEVRYSEVCRAAWARITQAAPGDTVEISVGGKGSQNGLVNADNDAFTPMTAVAEGTKATACATVKATGAKVCTDQ
ncbi:helix-turn-helix domain-containing protein [Streptomyces sp. NPDC020141]|uniref:helix-turn-helix domain-containing protein n=1 Tax=Streptomyces sp. NPDC020141 TaxID=3365065 RepID=UPI0037B974E7